MTEEQIIKDLSDWVEYGDDSGYLLSEILDLINRQKEQIEALTAGQETLQKYIVEKDAEIERLKPFRDTAYEVLIKHYAIIKSEAVKEFAERLKDRPRKHLLLRPDSYYKQYVRVTDIDNLVKEMVGEG